MEKPLFGIIKKILCLAILLMNACQVPTFHVETITLLPASATMSPEPSPTLEVPIASPSLTSTERPTVTPNPTFTLTPTPHPVIRFAVIGDYGLAVEAEARVAELVQSWQPDLVITTGDNNYPDGSASTIDENIGQYYHEFIFPYLGGFGAGADRNRFFPSLGNHDYRTDLAQPYLDYFTLPGNERYYDFIWEPVHFFALNSDPHEPDGVGKSSIQATWLQQGLANSTQVWNVVYMHHPPYSSGFYGSIDWMQWPFAEWGVDIVLAGHDHTYERLVAEGVVYFVNGLGGGGRYIFLNRLPSSLARYRASHGAMLITADELEMNCQFININFDVIDSFTLRTVSPLRAIP